MESVIEQALGRNRSQGHAARVPLDKQPRQRLVIITCMDCRIDVWEAFGLEPGDANVLRNAGGIVTDDTLRSLVLSQRLLGTREVMVVHHTDCGLHGFDEAAFEATIRAETGTSLPFSMLAFADVEDDVRTSVQRVRECPFLVDRTHVRGFVYDVMTNLVHEVTVD